MAFPGFNRAKRSTISNGDWDRDGVKNKKDCQPFNFRKQGPEHQESTWEPKPPKCPKCRAQTNIQDDSFEHDWAGGGTEVIRYAQCPKCGWEEE